MKILILIIIDKTNKYDRLQNDTFNLVLIMCNKVRTCNKTLKNNKNIHNTTSKPRNRCDIIIMK